MEQASKPSVNEQNQVQPPPDNKRNRILKLLALKVAAHLKWDLDILEKRYESLNGIPFGHYLDTFVSVNMLVSF